MTGVAPTIGSAPARGFALALVLAAALPLAFASHASAAELPDASCPGDPATNGSSNGPDRLGQTFTALNTGQLTSATMTVSSLSNPDPFSMQIRPLDGTEPGDDASAIATESVPAPAGNAFTPISANFATPASVVAGQQYALVLQRGSAFATVTSAVACAGDSWATTPAGGADWFAMGDLVYSVFVTVAPPDAVTGSATSVGFDSAVLNGTVDPNGAATTYHFEIVDAAQHAIDGFDSATSVPASEDGDAGSGTDPGAVDETASGLAASTQYHFRLVAESAGGSDTGSVETFTTAASNEFEIGKAKLNKEKGTAKLPVSVPGVGTVMLGGSKVKPDSEDAQGAGEVDLTVKAKGKARKQLNNKGKANVTAEVTFTPDGGSPNTEDKKIKLKKR